MLPYINALGGHTGTFGCTFAALGRLWRRAVRVQGVSSYILALAPWRLPPRLRDRGWGRPVGVGLMVNPRTTVFPFGLLQVLRWAVA